VPSLCKCSSEAPLLAVTKVRHGMLLKCEIQGFIHKFGFLFSLRREDGLINVGLVSSTV